MQQQHETQKQQPEDSNLNANDIHNLKAPNDPAQRPPPETHGRLRQSRPNCLNRTTAQRGGGSLQGTG